MIYLDNAATTMKKPDCVIHAVVDAMTNAGNAGRGVHAASLHSLRILSETRKLIAELVNFDYPERVCFTANITEALNLAIYGFFYKGDHVITTMLEHNSVLRPLYHLEEEGIIRLTILPADAEGCISYQELERAICPETKAIVMAHASNLTGNVQDLHRIGNICRRHKVHLIVDAAQTAGTIPIDMQAMNISILCLTGHKSLMGPQGTGAILVRDDITLQPLKRGGTGIHSYDHHQPDAYPDHLEAGTQNIHGIAGLKAALEYIRQIGIDQIHQKEMHLAHLFLMTLGVIPGDGVRVSKAEIPERPKEEVRVSKPEISVISEDELRVPKTEIPAIYIYGTWKLPEKEPPKSFPPVFETASRQNGEVLHQTTDNQKIMQTLQTYDHVGIVTLNIGDYDSAAVSDELAERFDIITRSGAHCAPLCHEALGTKEQGAVRFSFSWFNTEEEVVEAAKAIITLATE